MSKHIAICGTAESTVGDAPYDDPEWEIWASLNGMLHVKRVDVLFEMHEMALLSDVDRQLLAASDKPIFMREEHAEFKNSVAYPFDSIAGYFGSVNLWTSSIAYMLALALSKRRGLAKLGKIGLWGIDVVAEGEYAHQRWALEYLIGWGRAKGVDIYVPPQSSLCKADYIYGLAQGGSPNRKAQGIDVEFLAAQIGRLEAEKQRIAQQMQLLANKNSGVDGAIAQCQTLVDYVRHYERGGTLVKK
jgi:hypothetical protein